MGYSVAEIAKTYSREAEEAALHRFYPKAVDRDGDFQQRLIRLPEFAGDKPLVSSEEVRLYTIDIRRAEGLNILEILRKN